MKIPTKRNKTGPTAVSIVCKPTSPPRCFDYRENKWHMQLQAVRVVSSVCRAFPRRRKWQQGRYPIEWIRVESNITKLDTWYVHSIENPFRKEKMGVMLVESLCSWAIIFNISSYPIREQGEVNSQSHSKIYILKECRCTLANRLLFLYFSERNSWYVRYGSKFWRRRQIRGLLWRH